jgi:hypothetical protein
VVVVADHMLQILVYLVVLGEALLGQQLLVVLELLDKVMLVVEHLVVVKVPAAAAVLVL